MWTLEQDRYYGTTPPEDAYRVARRILADSRPTPIIGRSESVRPSPNSADVPKVNLRAVVAPVVRRLMEAAGARDFHTGGIVGNQPTVGIYDYSAAEPEDNVKRWLAGGLMKNRPIYAAEPPQVFNDYSVSRGSDGWHVSGPGGFYKHFHANQRLHAELFAAALNVDLAEVGRIGWELRGIEI